jgi:tetratricopeptide (TPR) repeat protein
MKNEWKILLPVCALVVATYTFMARSGPMELLSPHAANTYYNLLVQGFRARQLSVKKEVPPGLTQLADPYTPSAFHDPYRLEPYHLLDLSYYKGRLYLYFGVTPALILFWPYVALTGHYLFHRQAVLIFCTVGFLTSVGLLYALWRRYFAEVSIWVVAACALALGLATGAPVLLSQADVYEVPICCGYMLTMLALAAIYRALREPKQRCRCLIAASTAYGLAVGARPSLLFGGIILLVPVVYAWRERQPIWAALAAATIPITLIGLGLMLYNALRFDSPFEFGMHYQLAGRQQVMQQFFSPKYLWFNFRVYFLEPSRWSTRSPFVLGSAMPLRPAGYLDAGRSFGVLTAIPLTWLALAVPLAWQNRKNTEASILAWFTTGVALLFGVCALTLGCFCFSYFRYEVDFLPALLLLSVIGIFGLERKLAPTSESGLANRPSWRCAVRGGYGLLLSFSVAFSLLASITHYAEAQFNMGQTLWQAGQQQAAVSHYEQALRIDPSLTYAHVHLGIALSRLGKNQDALAQLMEALRLSPDSPEVHNDLGDALLQADRLPEAIEHYEHALQIRPDYAEAHSNLGVVLSRTGKMQEAIAHYEQALNIKPDAPEIHYNLGFALLKMGRAEEATRHYSDAVRLRPNYAEAHLDLGTALLTQGKMQDAIQQYKEAIRIKPDYPQARVNLGLALAQAGQVPEAMKTWQEELILKPDDAEAHYYLGMALETLSRPTEAVEQYEQALKLREDFTAARDALARLRSGQTAR